MRGLSLHFSSKPERPSHARVRILDKSFTARFEFLIDFVPKSRSIFPCDSRLAGRRWKIFSCSERRSGFVVTFRVYAGMQTKIRDEAENSGEEIFRATRDHVGATLICKLFNSRVKSGILPEDLEYKTCPLDLTLTGKL